jgi:hypothetical protein
VDVASFAQSLLRALLAREPRAVHLSVKARGKKAVIGIDEGENWVELLRLSNPSAAVNVMNLDVPQGRGWAPTFERGVPEKLAEALTGPLAFTWLPEIDAVLAWRETSGSGH